MNSSDRLRAIFLIWAAFAAATIATVWGNSVDVITLFMALFYSMAALGGTYFVMYAPPDERAAEGKMKRRNVDRLLTSLSDAELDELRARLSADDGELVSLDQLMREREGRR